LFDLLVTQISILLMVDGSERNSSILKPLIVIIPEILRQGKSAGWRRNWLLKFRNWLPGRRLLFQQFVIRLYAVKKG
jgi:hypothetical protein